MIHQALSTAPELDRSLSEKLLDKEVVFPGKIIRLEHWHVSLPNGETALREVAVHPGAAAVVALDEEGCVLMVRQHRIAVDRLTWEIPAGKLDSPDESPLVCAKRELSEETGGFCSSMTVLGTYYGSAGIMDEIIYLYFARLTGRGSAHPDEDEFLTVEKIAVDELEGRIARGEIQDGKTLSAFALARSQHLI